MSRPFCKQSICPPQLNYADMLKRVEPLRNELQKLEDDAKDNQQKANEVERMIRELEASIARYKEEYAVLISEAQAIKADLAAVEAKVRWSSRAHSFCRSPETLPFGVLHRAVLAGLTGGSAESNRQHRPHGPRSSRGISSFTSTGVLVTVSCAFTEWC